MEHTSSSTSQRILVIDDDEGVRNFISRGLTRRGFATVAADGGTSGISQLSSSKFDAVVCDLNMPDRDGLDVLRFTATLTPRPAFIVLTGFGSISVAVEAMKHGAADFIEKPVSIEALGAAITAVLNRKEAARAPARVLTPASGGRRLVGSDMWLDVFMDKLKRIATSDATVLIEGETGTGKSAVAREIWRNSGRAKGPFVEMNCAAIPDSLMESELFGHKKGSFSGAIADYVGHVEQASGGTLFLDEIGELKHELQAKLLQLLQEKTYSPIGSARAQQADVRFLAATNRNLEAEVDAGRFRSDLYYRLNVVDLTIPPLRDRPQDVPLLVEHFRAVLAERHSAETPPVFSQEALEVMMRYSWRGNVRELENLVARMAVIHAPATTVEPQHLPPRMLDEAGRLSSPRQETPQLRAPPPRAESVPPRESAGRDLKGDVADMERQRITAALQACNGNKTKAAVMLGMKRTTLVEKAKRLGITSGDDPPTDS